MYIGGTVKRFYSFIFYMSIHIHIHIICQIIYRIFKHTVSRCKLRPQHNNNVPHDHLLLLSSYSTSTTYTIYYANT